MSAMTSTAVPLRQRQLEIESALASRGLLRGPRRILASARRASQATLTVAELYPVLEELGAVFAAFGRYLSRRADLFQATDCLQLGDLPDSAAASPPAAVNERLERGLGRPRREIFSAFDEAPFESRWLYQSHRARLQGGERVVVKVVHPEVEDHLESEVEAVTILQQVFSSAGLLTAERFRETHAAFRRAVAARLDMAVEAGALQVLGRDARRSDLLLVPQVHRELSTARVLTVQWLPGSTVDEIAALPDLQPMDAFDMARRIALIWLQMALVGHRFPIEADLIELPDGRLAVTGGVFAELPEASRVNLWNYLRATAGHFPDRAAACLLRETSRARRGAPPGELRTRVRQAVPFRDGAWSVTGESLGEYAMVHWRLLRDAGFSARQHLEDFYQGLFWAARRGRRFAPRADPLGEALSDLDWLAGWNQFRQLASPRQLGMTAESYVSSLVELPQKLDRILSFAADEGGFRLPEAETGAGRERQNSAAVVISLGLAMAGVVLLAEQGLALGAALGWSDAWSEGLLAGIFTALGCLLLSRARRLR